MHIILGGTGHVGSAAARALLDRAEAVTVVAHDAAKADGLRAAGAEVAVVDVRDVEALRRVFRTGRRAFLLNPPADPAGDTDAEETATAAAIVAALDGSGLEKVVAASTYGAQAGDRIGDLSVLWGFEQALKAQPIPAAISRGAYYFSNWDGLLAEARDEARISTPYPPDLPIPMVAPADLGAAAARRLIEPADSGGLRFVEGPQRYSSADVAAAFGRALDRAVAVEVTPRSEWKAAFIALGFSDGAAESYARMTEVSVDGGFDMPASPEKGPTTLDAYIADLVAADRA